MIPIEFHLRLTPTQRFVLQRKLQTQGEVVAALKNEIETWLPDIGVAVEIVGPEPDIEVCDECGYGPKGQVSLDHLTSCSLCPKNIQG